jgi:hypothetical protein
VVAGGRGNAVDRLWGVVCALDPLDDDGRGDLLDRAQLVALNEGVEAEVADAVLEHTKVEGTGTEAEAAADAEAGEVDAVEDTDVGELEDSLELAKGEEVGDVELGVLLEDTLEGRDVEVLLKGELLEELEVEVVDAGNIGKVLPAELGEQVGVEVDGALLNGRGGSRSDQGGEGRDDDSGELHFGGCRGNDLSQTNKKLEELKKRRAQLKNVQK